jgi:hypothetical protein
MMVFISHYPPKIKGNLDKIAASYLLIPGLWQKKGSGLLLTLAK